MIHYSGSEMRLSRVRLHVFVIGDDDVLRYRNRLCVPDVDDPTRELMVEAHQTVYTMHLGSTKMYKDLKVCY